MSWPPSLQDFYAFGLSPAACVPDTRAPRSFDVAHQFIELPGHGFQGGETLFFQTSGIGSALPTGLVATTPYLAVKSSSHFFGITNLDGSPASFADAGSGLVNVLQDMEPIILQILAGWASDVMSNAKAYKPPYSGPVPLTLTKTACYGTAYDVACRMRVASPQFDMDDVREKLKMAQATIIKLDRGEPLAETVTDATPDVAEMGAAPARRRRDFDFEHRRDGLEVA